MARSFESTELAGTNAVSDSNGQDFLDDVGTSAKDWITQMTRTTPTVTPQQTPTTTPQRTTTNDTNPTPTTPHILFTPIGSQATSSAIYR